MKLELYSIFKNVLKSEYMTLIKGKKGIRRVDNSFELYLVGFLFLIFLNIQHVPAIKP